MTSGAGMFARLRASAGDSWHRYVDHEFVRALGAGTLPEAAFRHYLVQDYLFLVQFARANALGAYKGSTLAEIRDGHAALGAILDEIPLHEKLCARWGLGENELAEADEEPATVAYTRYVLDVGMRGDLLDLQVALAPCVIGYAEIGAALSPRLAGHPEHPYAEWIGEYAGLPYQQSAREAEARLDVLVAGRLTDTRYAELERIFATATRCEAQFWQSSLDRAG